MKFLVWDVTCIYAIVDTFCSSRRSALAKEAGGTAAIAEREGKKVGAPGQVVQLPARQYRSGNLWINAPRLIVLPVCDLGQRLKSAVATAWRSSIRYIAIYLYYAAFSAHTNRECLNSHCTRACSSRSTSARTEVAWRTE